MRRATSFPKTLTPPSLPPVAVAATRFDADVGSAIIRLRAMNSGELVNASRSSGHNIVQSAFVSLPSSMAFIHAANFLFSLASSLRTRLLNVCPSAATSSAPTAACAARCLCCQTKKTDAATPASKARISQTSRKEKPPRKFLLL